MRWNWIDDSSDDKAEDDVAIEMAPLRDGATHNSGAGGCKSALKQNIISVACFQLLLAPDCK